MIAEWLASKTIQIVVVILALIGLICGPGMAVQTIRLNGLHVFGWSVMEGWKPRYEALVAKDAADELARSKAALKLAQDQQKALADSNAAWAAKVADLNGRVVSLQGRIDSYVPKEIAVACVPTGLALVLNYAVSGTAPEQIPAPTDELNRTCSGISVRDAADSLVYDLGQLPILRARIANARDAWQAQYELTNGPPQ